MPSLPMVIPERGQSERDLAQRLNVPTVVVARLSGSVTLLDGGGRKVEIGLGIKSRRQRLVAVGWCRLRPSAGGSDEVWEYLGLAERTLREYQAEFPSLLCPTEPRVSVAGVTAAHAPGEAVLYVRGSGPVPFGERGIVLATQGARCEVIFEHEGFCSFGHFSRLETSRAAVVPAAALLNLSRPPRSKAADAPPDAAAALFGGGSDSFAAFAKGTNPYAVLSQAPAE
ncbi:hypothetical protein EMIHUDRAFT_457414 [Emiliania huxleyi CCMP1516]|uniref:Uncharacterized protein n=2 Tax=Emiliania huxleyi TaxID=2903 RepID=A0A0D3JRJ2_EMIH1|nr:hypothetical protein EMIHUDRAFT_457414 [Emiliania huxleyi CCMP1516]EOD26127.1 hypothetical protein EMIHUDRAFT_457414 [Emiliania huxleyi CCMP1516]|eukprot:XP_005778556.1 hypothetical protein EMIHUDRAFT_457414 [Emiliania huxleyi CCMP1516]